MAQAPVEQRQTQSETDIEQPRPWNVVLLDDDEHTFEYVIAMMQTLFGHTFQKAFKIAETVNAQGRAICLTTHKEHAELKREQILGFGADPLLERSAGAMSAIIEPADFGDDGMDEEGE
jgi:ATP-dependent Clp protease adaptor protein ClpS